MAEPWEGWEGSALYSQEVTAGTPVAPALAFGVVKNLSHRTSASMEDEDAIGTYKPYSLEEGVEEVGGSCEFLPVSKTALVQAKRDVAGRLPSNTIHATAGPGVNQTGAKFNQVRFALDAGGRLRATMEWWALASIDQTAIAAVLPTTETFNWIKCATNLSAEVASLEFVIAHNLRRVPVIANAGTVLPVTGQKRPPWRIKEGVQRVSMNARFFERPTENVIADILTEIAAFELSMVGVVGGTPIKFKVQGLNGKPSIREFNASAGGDASWPVECKFKDFDIVDIP